MIDEDFRTKLVALTDLPVEKGTVGEDKDPPWVYYERGEENTDLLHGGTPSLTTTRFDVEVVGTDQAEVQTEAAALKTGLNGQKATTFGSSFVHGCFVEDHSDDYESKSIDADEGYYVAAFSATVIH